MKPGLSLFLLLVWTSSLFRGVLVIVGLNCYLRSSGSFLSSLLLDSFLFLFSIPKHFSSDCELFLVWESFFFDKIFETSSGSLSYLSSTNNDSGRVVLRSVNVSGVYSYGTSLSASELRSWLPIHWMLYFFFIWESRRRFGTECYSFWFLDSCCESYLLRS